MTCSSSLRADGLPLRPTRSRSRAMDPLPSSWGLCGFSPALGMSALDTVRLWPQGGVVDRGQGAGNSEPQGCLQAAVLTPGTFDKNRTLLKGSDQVISTSVRLTQQGPPAHLPHVWVCPGLLASRDQMKMNDVNARAGHTVNAPQMAAITHPSNIPSVPVLCAEGIDTWPDS